MHEDKPLKPVKAVAARVKNDGEKRKTVKRQKTLKVSDWYEKAALSIKAARTHV